MGITILYQEAGLLSYLDNFAENKLEHPRIITKHGPMQKDAPRFDSTELSNNSVYVVLGRINV